MKPLNDYINERYINEKLKLSDINKDKLYDAEWVDADTLKFADLEEGNIVEVRNKRRYVVIPRSLITPWQKSWVKYILITQDGSLNHLEDYVSKFPKVSDYGDEWDIVKIYTRKRHYTSKAEVKDDTQKLYQF